MDQTHEASERLQHQREGRLRVLRAQLPELAAAHERAVARGGPRAAHSATRLRRVEETLAALERTIAAEAAGPLQP